MHLCTEACAPASAVLLGVTWMPGSCGCQVHTTALETGYAKEQVNMCYSEGILLSFNYITLGQERNRFSFRLTNLVPGSSWACAGSCPYPISFLDLLGFQALILPFMVRFLNVPKFCCGHLISTAHVLTSPHP